MKVIALKGHNRENIGKSGSKKLRNEGKVPCVVYGKSENVNFSIYQADFKNLVYTPDTYLVKLDLDGGSKLAKVQELQYHPVSEDIVHADFFEINPEKPISIAIPVKIEGNSPGVRAGGKLQVKIKKLNVLGLVKDLPENIIINIDQLEIGKSIKIKELSVPNLKLLDSPANSVASCIITRAARAAGVAAAAEKAGKK